MNNFVVIGLGSMGKRRVRCLIDLGIKPENIFGFDTREDRCVEAIEKYQINVMQDVEEINYDTVKAVIVSLPPDKHAYGVSVAQKHHKPVFIEASVILDDVVAIKEANPSDVFLAPSCTFRFHPMISSIRDIVKSEKYGKVSNFSYHSGQFLPDWHPWEKVTDFYVGNRNTGGCREIVPYELTWMIEVFGYPEAIKGYFRKTEDVGCEIEDSYACCLSYKDKVGTLIVDVTSRYAVRNLIINFERGQIQWRWDKKQIEIYDALTQEWKYIVQKEQKHIEGYNTNIGEDMYVEEIRTFLIGIDNPSKYPTNIDYDIAILKLLNAVEDSDGGFNK